MPDALHDGAWEGETCIIVFGGPSLRDFNWSLLHDRPEKIIVINRAYIDCQHADAFFTEDLSFVEEFSKRPSWDTFQGVKVFHTLGPDLRSRALAADPSLFIVEKKSRAKIWSTSLADGLSQSSNSGIGALNLADILGCKRIYLLGLDCIPTRGKMEHYHDDYEGNYQLEAPGSMLIDFASDFKLWAAVHLKKRNREIVNLNMKSAVNCWAMWDRDWFFSKAVPREVKS